MLRAYHTAEAIARRIQTPIEALPDLREILVEVRTWEAHRIT